MVTTKHTNLLIIQFIYIVFYYIRLFATRVKKKKGIYVGNTYVRTYIHTYVIIIENKKDAYEKTIFEFK